MEEPKAQLDWAQVCHHSTTNQRIVHWEVCSRALGSSNLIFLVLHISKEGISESYGYIQPIHYFQAPHEETPMTVAIASWSKRC